MSNRVHVWDAEDARRSGWLQPGMSWFPNTVNGVYAGPVLHCGDDGLTTSHAMGEPCDHPACAKDKSDRQ